VLADAASVITALRDGVLLGIQFNPLFAVVTAALAAAAWGYPKARRDRRWQGVLVIAVGWLAGDGLRILARARDYLDASATYVAAGLPVWPGWTNLAVWAFVSLVVGYAAPAVVGGSVGRRVTHGTGWLAAGAMAVALTLAISAGVGALS